MIGGMTSSDRFPAPTLGARLGALVLWLAFLLGYGVGGWFLVLEPVVVAVGNWWQARDYVETRATVVRKEGRDADGAFTWYAASYEVSGQTRETGRLSVLEDTNIDERFNATIVKFMQAALAEQRPISVGISAQVRDRARQP
jgi:hypothetical protein